MCIQIPPLERDIDFWLGDSAELLTNINDDTIDSIVSDPPYGLSFMGKDWDKALPPIEIWKECVRILKPGGYLVAMSASRTYHRLAVQLEDLGLICHPMIGWIYGSGFPKATDLSKQFDKAAGAEREIVGEHIQSAQTRKPTGNALDGSADGSLKWAYDITAPSTDQAKKWNGWKYGLQALKPALESCFVGQKPCEPIDILEHFMLDISQQLEDVCQLQSNVSIVELISKLGRVGYLKENIAQELVRIKQELEKSLDTGRADALKERTAILQSLLMGNINSNTESFYLSTLAESYCLLSILITRMGINQITESKISNWSELESIYRDITLQLKLIGDKSHASTAGNLLKSLCVRLKLLISTIAIGLATEKHVKKAKDQAAKQNPKLDLIFVGQKPHLKPMIKNVEKWGCGAMNIDACRVITKDTIKNQTNQNIKNNSYKSDNSNRERDSEYVPSDLGRFPANLIHDGSESVEDEFLRQGGITKSGGKKNATYANENDGIFTFGGSQTTPFAGSAGSCSRYFNSLPISQDDFVPFLYQAKASKKERNAGLEGMEEKDTYHSPNDTNGEGGLMVNSNPRCLNCGLEKFNRVGIGKCECKQPNYKISKTKPNQNFHPTCKPIALMEWLVKLVTPPEGICIDPFMGSGTTGIACKKNGFRFIGIEMNEEYYEIAKRRLSPLP